MKIRDLLAIESIDVHASAADKNEIIRKAIDLMEKSGKIAERAPYEEQVYNREKESTTGVGSGDRDSPWPQRSRKTARSGRHVSFQTVWIMTLSTDSR